MSNYYPFYRSRSPFSNFYQFTFVHQGITFDTSEKAIMYRKAKLFGAEDIANKIISASTPADAKRMGRSKKIPFNPVVWDKHKISIFREILIDKFSNAEMKKKLYETGEMILVEASPYDKIWGVGLAVDDPRVHDKSQWKGQNLLGYILTDIREQFKKDDLQVMTRLNNGSKIGLQKLTLAEAVELKGKMVRAYTLYQSETYPEVYVDYLQEEKIIKVISPNLKEGGYILLTLDEKSAFELIKDDNSKMSDLGDFFSTFGDGEDYNNNEMKYIIDYVMENGVTPSQVKQEGSISKARKYFGELPLFDGYYHGHGSSGTLHLVNKGDGELLSLGANVVEVALATLMDFIDFEVTGLKVLKLSLPFNEYRDAFYTNIVEIGNLVIFTDYMKLVVCKRDALLNTLKLPLLKKENIKTNKDIESKGCVLGKHTVAVKVNNVGGSNNFPNPLNTVRVILQGIGSDNSYVDFYLDSLVGKGKTKSVFEEPKDDDPVVRKLITEREVIKQESNYTPAYTYDF